MKSNILSLSPKKVWYYFNEICLIPRPSGAEEKIVQFLIDFAESHRLEYKKDEIGNVVIKKVAKKGLENKPIIVLQSHIDMVCEKNNETIHDFYTDPIIPYIDNEWVTANGTTLGGDDGIGVAAMLAVLDSDNLVHGPIECLFTVDEERGLDGANALKSDFIDGRILLNLDSEEMGEIYIGCAGGKGTKIKIPLTFEQIPIDSIAIQIGVKGLRGGHSGDEIHKGLGNANKILVRLLYKLQKHCNLRLSSIQGGKQHNAIAREANANIFIPKIKADKFLEVFDVFNREVLVELKAVDPEVKLYYNYIESDIHVIELNIQQKLISSLYSCPHGVIRMSDTLPGLVETSTNLASVKMEEDYILITTSQRSSVSSSLEDVVNMVRCNFELVNGLVEHSTGYPGWNPNLDSPILNTLLTKYEELYKAKPEIKAIHAGLECGVLGEKFQGIDMVSFGPTLRNVHSPDEKLNIPSVSMFWELLIKVLAS